MSYAFDDELEQIIRAAITSTERDLQKEIGPSEIGTECVRRLAYTLAQVPEVNTDPDGKWRPAVGTFVHAGLASMFVTLNSIDAYEAATNWSAGVQCHAWCELSEPDDFGLTYPMHRDRFLIEHKMLCGTVNERQIMGSIDLFDRLTKTAVDWKIVGHTTLKNVKRSGPEKSYQVQINTYARGLIATGEAVESVAIVYLPSAGILSDRFFWCADVDLSLPKEAFKRARVIDTQLNERGLELIGFFKRENAHCAHCPWFAPGSTDATEACPGHPSMFVDRSSEWEGLLPTPQVS